MVYVCENGFANHDAFFDAVYEFAVDATERIANAERPSLVIIANKWSGDDGMAQADVEDILRPEWTTDRFFSEHDPDRTLLMHFHDVVVMALPNRNVVLTLDDESTCSLAALFDAHVDRLLQTILRLIEAKHEDRRSRGNLLCESAWLGLFHQLMLDFYVPAGESETGSIEIRHVDMSGTMLKVLMDHDEVLAGGTALFRAIRARQLRALQDAPRLTDPAFIFQNASVLDGMLAGNERTHYVPLLPTRKCPDAPTLAFVQALRATLPMIALASLRQPLDFIDSADMFEAETLLPGKQEELWTPKVVEPALVRFLSQVEALQPCSACYDDPRGTFSTIFCDQPRQNHPAGAHSNESRLILEYDKSWFAKAMGGFWKRFSRMSKQERDQARTRTRDAIWTTAEGEGRWLPSKTVHLPPRQELLGEARRRYDMVFDMLKDPSHRRGVQVKDVLGLAQSMLCDWAFTNEEPMAFQATFSKVFDSGRCLVCLRKYSGKGEGEERKRLSLHCGHVLCRSCFECLKSAKTGSALNGDTPQPLLEMSSDLMMGLSHLTRCPFCKHELKAIHNS